MTCPWIYPHSSAYSSYYKIRRMKLTSRTSLFLSSAITGSWNALIDSSSDAKEISGVIDLDEAEVVPIPVARRPPIWPWHFSKEPETGFLNSD